MTTAEQFRDDFNLSGERRTRTTAPGFVDWSGGPITAPGAYRNVPNDFYHGNGEWHGKDPCDSPSISAGGLKILSGSKGARTKGQTPRHYWEQSNLNPKRRPSPETEALRWGKGFHDGLLLPDTFDTDYHVLPEGFSRAKTKAMADEIAAADAAIARGMTCLSEEEVGLIWAMVDAFQADPLVKPFLGNGEAEVTFAWKDPETGVWLRARPDWMLSDLSAAMNFKTAADASWTGFSRAIAANSYVQSAALELDGYKAVFGEAPSRYLFPVIEKPTKSRHEDGDYIATALWELPEEDIDRGRWLNRMAINTFAECLSSGKWPGYTDEPEFCGLPSYARHVIDNGGAAEPYDDEINA